MRTIVSAFVLTAIVLTGSLEAATKGTPPADVGAGHCAWFDITTTNLSRAKDFYGKLFRWEFVPVAGTDQATEIVADARSIGTIRVADGKIGLFNGVVYIQVDDIRASCAKANSLGGKVLDGFPFNLGTGSGAIALLTDPTGHPIGLWSKAQLPVTPSK